MENAQNKWNVTQVWVTAFAAVIALGGIFGILRIHPDFSMHWTPVVYGILTQSEMMLTFFSGHSFVILPDLLTQSVLFGLLAFNSIKTRISSALLATLGIMGILYYGVNIVLSTSQGMDFNPITLVFAAPALIVLIVGLITNKFSSAPLNTLNSEASRRKTPFYLFPYYLFNKISLFTEKQHNKAVAILTQALLFVLTAKIVALLFYGIVLIVAPLVAYMALWSLIIAGIILVGFFILRLIFGGSNTGNYSTGSDVAVDGVTGYDQGQSPDNEQNDGEQNDSSDGRCPYKGRVLAGVSTNVLGFNWPSQDTIFQIEDDWSVSNSRGFEGWVDVKGRIHKSNGGSFDIRATLSGTVVAEISGSSCYAGGQKIGSKVNW